MTPRTLLSSLLLSGLTALAAPALAQDAPPPEDTGTEVVTDVAVTGQGEAAIADALANAMVEAGAAADADLALSAVQDLRAQGMGWGEVAHELGFNLGGQVSAVRSQGRSATGRIIAETDDIVIEATAAGATDEGVAALDRANRGVGADTAASARLNAEVGRGTAAEARAGARVDVGAGVRGRPLIQVPERPLRPTRPLLPERPLRGGGR